MRAVVVRFDLCISTSSCQQLSAVVMQVLTHTYSC
jgi:hypothetical protein